MVLSQRIKNKINPSRKFYWHGNPIPAKSRKNLTGNNTYYSGFDLDDMEIQVGDCVCISASATLSTSDYYVGRIRECFDNGADEDSHRAHIQWYSRLEELPKKHHKYIPEGYPEYDSSLEILKDLTEYSNDTDIDTIVSKCYVTEVESSADPSEVKRPHSQAGHFFVCRFMYQRTKPWFLPIINIPEDKKSLKCFLEPGSLAQIKMPAKLHENKENTPTKRIRRRTAILSESSILQQLNEEGETNFQPLREGRKNPVNEKKSTPLKQRLSIIESKVSTLNLRSPTKSTPLPKSTLKVAVKDCMLDVKKWERSQIKAVTPLKERLLEVEGRVSRLSLNTPKKAAPTAGKKSRRASVAQSCATTFELPRRCTPIKGHSTQLEIARSQLHVSAVPTSLPCREEEFQQIYSFVEGKLLDSIGGCLYVSGVPGTGKTATVNEVMKLLKEVQVDGSLPAFDLLHINAMKLTKPHQLWVQMWKDISGEKVTSEHAAKLLATHLTKSTSKRKCIALILDELDLLWTKKQDVMYNLFDWSSQVGSKLVVVAIANTMDLPERMMMSRVSSRLGLTRMTFQPYTFNQLQEIITARLSGIDAFDSDAIQFVSRKVAALSGDARRALDICRRATEIAEHSCLIPSPSKKMKNSKSSKANKGVVGMEHVSKAIEEMFSSSMINAISRCSKVEKILLQAVIAEFNRTGLEEAVLEQVLRHIDSLCRMEGMNPPSSSQVLLLLQSLSSQRILLAEHSRLDLMLRIRLNVSVDDIIYAIQEKSSRG